MVNCTLLNFGKRYEDDLRVIFDQCPKLHLGLDVLSNQNILKGIYYIHMYYCKKNDKGLNSKAPKVLQKLKLFSQELGFLIILPKILMFTIKGQKV